MISVKIKLERHKAKYQKRMVKKRRNYVLKATVAHTGVIRESFVHFHYIDSAIGYSFF